MIDPNKDHCAFVPSVLFSRNQLSPYAYKSWINKVILRPHKELSELMNGIRCQCLPKQIKICFVYGISIRTRHTLRHTRAQRPKPLWSKINHYKRNKYHLSSESKHHKKKKTMLKKRKKPNLYKMREIEYSSSQISGKLDEVLSLRSSEIYHMVCFYLLQIKDPLIPMLLQRNLII